MNYWVFVLIGGFLVGLGVGDTFHEFVLVIVGVLLIMRGLREE